MRVFYFYFAHCDLASNIIYMDPILLNVIITILAVFVGGFTTSVFIKKATKTLHPSLLAQFFVGCRHI